MIAMTVNADYGLTRAASRSSQLPARRPRTLAMRLCQSIAKILVLQGKIGNVLPYQCNDVLQDVAFGT